MCMHADGPACAGNEAWHPVPLPPACLPAGELWRRAGRLPWDWSYAGYEAGEAPIPELPVVMTVKVRGRALGEGLAACSVHTLPLPWALSGVRRAMVKLCWRWHTQPALTSRHRRPDTLQDFGAKGDGATDDSDAFTRAIAAMASVRGGGTLFVPRGRYVITKRLYINTPSTVIKGAGLTSTTLYYPLPLKALSDGGGS